MNEKDYSEEQKQLPSLGAAFFFSNKFGNSQFEYGFNRWVLVKKIVNSFITMSPIMI